MHLAKPSLAVKVFAFLCTIVALFQLALAAGAPWGSFAMGGRFPGVLPPAFRLLCLAQILVLAGLVVVVLVRAGLLWPQRFEPARKLIWVVVAFSAVALLANLATSSEGERLVWAPVAALLLLSSLVVARS